MKLYAFDWKSPVTQSHNHSGAIFFVRIRTDFKLLRQPFFSHNQGVIARGRQWLRSAPEQRSAIVLNAADLAMHHSRRPYHIAAKRCAQRLMSQTHSQNRPLTGKTADQFNADTCLMRSAWAGRNQYMIGVHLLH